MCTYIWRAGVYGSRVGWALREFFQPHLKMLKLKRRNRGATETVSTGLVLTSECRQRTRACKDSTSIRRLRVDSREVLEKRLSLCVCVVFCGQGGRQGRFRRFSRSARRRKKQRRTVFETASGSLFPRFFLGNSCRVSFRDSLNTSGGQAHTLNSEQRDNGI